MSEDFIIKNCSPTLAGIKTGNLFTCTYESKDELKSDIRAVNQILVPKGLRMLLVKYLGAKALLYVFRPSKLMDDFTDDNAREMLCQKGYDPKYVSQNVVKLIKKMQNSNEFPHEIGLFLGYPPKDVEGFIRYNGAKCKYSGCWKVYDDVNKSKKLFDKYKKCTAVYQKQLAKGSNLSKLALSI